MGSPPSFEQVLTLVDENETFLVSGHVLPDGDCLGAQCALYHLLTRLGKQVRIVNQDPPEPRYAFLAAHTPFGVDEASRPLPPHDVHCLVDCSTLDRLGTVGEKARELFGVRRLVVDHHVGSDEGDGDVLLWDPHACSSGSLVRELQRQIGVELTKEGAEGVFVSIVSDTGWFVHSNTTEQALATAAELVGLGVDPHAVYVALRRGRRPETVGLLAEGLARAAIDGRVAVCELDGGFMERAEAARFDTDELLEPLRAVDGVDVVVLLKERRAGVVKLSLRASERVEVDGAARALGGGGHRRAAGATLAGDLASGRERVLAALRPILDELEGDCSR